MKSYFIVAFALLICIATKAQTTAKVAKVKKLMEVTGTARNMKLAFEQSIALQQRNSPGIDSTFWIEFKKQMSADDLVNVVIPIYEKYYSEEDLDGLIAFYSTPLGQRILRVQPLIQQESMAAGEKWGRELGERIVQRMKEEQGLGESNK